MMHGTARHIARTSRRSVSRRRCGRSALGLLALVAMPTAAIAQNTIAAGSRHSLAIKTDGTLWAWGWNERGQLGDETTEDRSVPGRVAGLDGVIAVAAGWDHTVALRSDGAVWAWGWNGWGQLGDGTAEDRSVPGRVDGLNGVIAIAGGWYHTVALRSDGTVWAWGENGAGQLGDGTTEDRWVPGRVADLSGVVGVAAAIYHTVALRSDGTVWAWGHNGSGQLGDGTTGPRSVPGRVTGLDGVIAIAGADHTVALRSDGAVWVWGYNGFGQLGDGTTDSRSVPGRVAGVDGVIAIAAGRYQTVALKSDGTVWAWGNNGRGQLGDGTTDSRSVPGRVGDLDGVIAIAAGTDHTLGLRSDGTVWAWGGNGSGQLGDGTSGNERWRPVQVTGLSDVMAPAEASIDRGIRWASTYTGAAGSSVTVRIGGIGLAKNAQVALVGNGGTRIDAQLGSEPGGHLIATFDLTSAPPGEYELVAENPDGEAFVAPEPFVVEPEKRVELWVDIVGRDAIRVGRPQTYHVMYGNRGNTDAVGVPLWIAGIPAAATVKLGFDVLPPVPLGDTPVDYSSVPTSFDVGNEIVVPLLLPVVPPGFTGALTFTLTVPPSEPFQLEAWVNPIVA